MQSALYGIVRSKRAAPTSCEPSPTSSMSDNAQVDLRPMQELGRSGSPPGGRARGIPAARPGRRGAAEGGRGAGGRGGQPRSRRASRPARARQRASCKASSTRPARAPSKCSIAFGFCDNRRKAVTDERRQEAHASVTILNEEYAIRSDTPPEHARAVAQYLDQAIRAVMSSGGRGRDQPGGRARRPPDHGRAVRGQGDAGGDERVDRALSDYVRPLLPPAKRTPGARSDGPQHDSARLCLVALVAFCSHVDTLAAVAKLTRRF